MAKLSLITSLFLAGHTLAQSNSTNETCPSAVRDIKEGGFGSWFNSTGTIAVQFPQQDEWRISVSLTDRRAENLRYGDYRSDQSIEAWLSVPKSLAGTEKGNETNVCLYMMMGKNVTATNATAPEDSCDGIIDEECMEEILDFKSPLKDGRCPRMKMDFSFGCGHFTASQIDPRNFTSSNCTLDELQNVDLDDDYMTYGGFPGGSFTHGDREIDSFEAYDLKVQQPIGMLLVTHYDGNVSSEMVCIAPNDLAEGSRVPQLELPDESRAVAMRVGWTGVLVGVAVLFSAL
ncbi:hypothetical protein NW752_009537 [Fusarium irregulare]|uniref:Uncharacterized protein n=1 Tax=Fusarium irregulare TaxID=2494466 RepID=A0A9W8PFB7_9HYPO|nr:hypothetical protein NW766_011531 [Fusarium irregulare]KAJ4009238.1 hypothetical protein NW752_009537 [Fusarium irregulare]